MHRYATAQHTGLRDAQCDATAVYTSPNGRAYVLLDGIGSSRAVREWTRAAARRLARAAARRGNAETGLRAVYERYAAAPERQDPYLRRYQPGAAAVVAVITPDNTLHVAWCGDSRAYLLTRGQAHRLTEDHNLRRVFPPTALHPYSGNRNVITSYLGAAESDAEVKARYGHAAVETASIRLDRPCRLLLASDGAYEPHEDAGRCLYAEVGQDDPRSVVREFVDLAVETSTVASTAVDPARPHADNATALLADIPA
ncbi:MULTISPECIES: PP2C family protein-serine/threonine phosphatase [Streptomyces]|uniref:PP2C family protein-serine/threonine phosphatase n=1 Tax=Streptomyces TaxID=1883 RepID=UPI0004C92366|nr:MULTISPECIES: protein phosphatase 2C domain-containing protein [Streptomyces]